MNQNLIEHWCAGILNSNEINLPVAGAGAHTGRWGTRQRRLKFGFDQRWL